MAAPPSRDPQSRMEKRGSSTILQQVNRSMQEVKRSVYVPLQRIELEKNLTQLAKEKSQSKRRREGRPLAGLWEGKQPVN